MCPADQLLLPLHWKVPERVVNLRGNLPQLEAVSAALHLDDGVWHGSNDLLETSVRSDRSPCGALFLKQKSVHATNNEVVTPVTLRERESGGKKVCCGGGTAQSCQRS
jgi:hypothetical protein